MDVLGLVGPSGSGKSHLALMVAHERSIELIIDDGLLINGNHIVAGVSSKRQSTKVGAIKTAMFFDNNHAEEVREKIAQIAPNKILILGTSEGMILRIVDRLNLPAPSEFIRIEEISTEEDIKKARKIRAEEGKHVVPAPTVEVKPRLSGLLIDPLPTFFGRKSSDKYNQFMVDQSVVQPTFNFYGKFFITSNAINQIITIGAKQVEGVEDIYHIRTRTVPEGIEINFHMSVFFGYSIPNIVKNTRSRIADILERMTSLHVLEINIVIQKMSIGEIPE
ncbi:MAG TPA: Asp23/Gls24 family envelope stress response protein [Clostridia bacterium]|nr:Asp23/Gls24 family envelope stress response protein [Clostridia bacterium]